MARACESVAFASFVPWALLEAAKTAVLRHELNRTPTSDLFFEILADIEKGQLT